MESTRLKFRRFTLSDLENMISLEGDPEIMKFTPSRLPHPREAIAQRLKARVEKEYSDAPFGVWAIDLKESGEFAGWICLLLTDQKFPELGFMFPKRLWGQGIATEAAKRMIQHAFVDLKVPGLVAKTDPANMASKKVLAKLGFKSAGTTTVADKILQQEVELDVFELLTLND